VDVEGYHLTAQCPVGNQRFRTHDAIALTWAGLFKQAGYLCRVEDPSCFREVEDTNKRADLVIENWDDAGGRAILDISVTHPWRDEVQRRSEHDIHPEAAACERETSKHRKYQNFIPANATFVPLVMESFGRWGPASRPLFKSCIERIAASRCIPKSTVSSYWKQRFAITLQKYTAACVRERAQRIAAREPMDDHRDSQHHFDYLDMAYVK
jgi:hypothetical protein